MASVSGNDLINSLKARLEGIQGKDVRPFGVDGHGMKLNPVLSHEDLLAIENKYSVTLPDEYREFLLIIGNGGAGPGYGLEAVEDGIAYQRRYLPDDILRNL